MGAVKAIATELQARQDEAIALGDAGTAYRLGLLEACRIISETSSRYLGVSIGDPFLATSDCWREVFDAAGYLREVSDRRDERERSQGPLSTIFPPTRSRSMPSITSKSTKAEILAAYEALLAQSQSETITPTAARNTAAVVIREARALVTDCYKAGTLSYQWVSGIIAELSQPVLRSNA